MYYTEKEDDDTVSVWFGIGKEDPNREVVAYCVDESKAHALIDSLNTARRLEEGYAEVIWKPEDVMDISKMSRDEAINFLESNQRRIRDRITELGWQVLSDVIAYKS